MGFWFVLALWAVSFVISDLLTPVPKSTARAAGLGDFNFPTATEGRVIPIVWGTARLDAPNVIWYGDLRKKAKKEKAGGMLSSKKVTVGYRYWVGMQMAFCYGPCRLRRVWIADKQVWSGDTTYDQPITIIAKGGEVKGVFYFYRGTDNQDQNAYLMKHQSPCPRYLGLCYGVWQVGDRIPKPTGGTGGYVGMTAQVDKWAVELTRTPNGLGLATPEVNTYDANPMNVIYEILTDTEWGFGYPSGDIDIANFEESAATLLSEGNGLSMHLDNPRQATDVIGIIEEQINGRLRVDAETGLWTMKLIRSDYVVGDLEAIDEDNSELISFSRGTWHGTTNEYKVEFVHRANEYSPGFAPSQDIANMRIQGRVHATTHEYVGVKDATLANQLAWRDLRELSYPIAKARVIVDRTFWNTYPGKAYRFNNSARSIVNLPMRVIRAEAGALDDGKIELELIQDVFQSGGQTFIAPAASEWVQPDMSMIPFDAEDQDAMESPLAFVRREENNVPAKILCLCQALNRGDDEFRVLQRNSAGAPSGIYYQAGDLAYMVRGTLSGNIGPNTTEVDVLADIDAEDFGTYTTTEFGDTLENIILIGDEFIIPTAATAITGGVELTASHRGVCDTAPAAHLDGETVWIVFPGLPSVHRSFTDNYNVDLKYLPRADGVTIEDDDPGITVIPVSLNRRADRPYPPTQVSLNASVYPATVDIASGATVAFNRRDFRIVNETSQLLVDASTINGDFPANNSTQYRLKLYDGVSLVWTGDWNAGAASLSVSLVKLLRAYDDIPANVTVAVETRHTYGGDVLEALQQSKHTAAVSGALADDVFLGTLDTYQTSMEWEAPASGTYAFSLGSALAGDVEAKVNGGAFATIISAGNTAGNLTGVVASDIIEVRHVDSASSDEVLLTINSPSHDEDARAVLIFDNAYPAVGGFGMGGFGTGPFGR